MRRFGLSQSIPPSHILASHEPNLQAGCLVLRDLVKVPEHIFARILQTRHDSTEVLPRLDRLAHDFVDRLDTFASADDFTHDRRSGQASSQAALDL